MNKSIHQRLNAHIIAAAAAVALAVPTASLARTVEIAAIKDGEATAAFGDADGRAYTLAWGYGPADGGAATNAWAHFETLGEVAAGATSASNPLPAGWGDTVTSLRFFLLEPELPAAATRVEYIEATGTQWIDTGVNLCSNDTVVADYANPAALLTKSVDLFGVHKHGMTARYFFSYSSGTTTMLFHRANGTQGATSTATDVTATPGTRQTVTMKIGPGTSSIVSASGETLFSETLTSQTVKQDATAPLAIFACNSSQYGIMALSAAKIYAFRIYDENNALRLDLVPCTVNGTPAMYDRVSRDYLDNSGTGSFNTGATMATPIFVIASSATASSDTYAAPDEYLDYVEATGAQMVNTECLLASNSVVVAEYAYPNPIVGHNNYLFGVYKSGMTAGYFYSNGGSFPLRFQKANGTSSASTTEAGINATPNARQIVTMRIATGATSTIVSQSGETLYSGVLTGTISQNATAPLVLLGLNNQGNLDSGYACSAKIYSFKIYDGDGKIARHFLPCIKNGVAGLYDKVSGRFFRSATATALVAGPVLPRPTEFVKWVQSDGADGDRQLYIDTGIVAKNDMNMVAELEWVEKPTVQSTFCGANNNASFLNLYTSGGTHQYGYSTSSAIQIQGGGNATTAGVRFRIVSSLVRTAQSLEAWALDGSGYHGLREGTSREWVNLETPFYLFARNDAGTPNQFAHVRLYSVSLTNELGVLRDFVPCVADNGRAGLYDRVSERVFFPQAAKSGATSNDFDPATEIGAVTNVLAATANAPSARLSYVESNGTSDYIDLGIIGKDGIKMVAEISWTVMPDDDVLCGARTGNNRFMLYNSYNNLHSYCYANGAPTVSAAGAPVVGDRYRITTVLEAGSQSCSVQKFANGAWSAANIRDNVNAAGPIDTGLPLYLFARNMDGVADAFAGARVYSLKLWQKNGNGDYQLVRDLVPAKGPEGGAALWDRVTNRYFRNAGGRYGLTAGAESPWIAGFMMRFR